MRQLLKDKKYLQTTAILFQATNSTTIISSLNKYTNLYGSLRGGALQLISVIYYES
jgi:hypothetical protein